MTVFLAILKIIGIILLVLLCILIGLLLIILFVPVRYEAEIVSEEKVRAKVWVTWLLHLVRFYLDYQNELSMKLYVLLFTVAFGRKKPKKEKDETENHADSAGVDTVLVRSESKVSDQNHTGDTALEREKTDTKRKEKKETKLRKENPIRRLKRIFASILDKLKHINETVKKGKTMMEDPHNKAALSHIKDEVFFLLKRICPKKLKVDLSYSTGSPDTTANVFGILAMFPIGYQNRWKIYPDFEADSFYARGTVYLKGKIYAYQIVLAALRLVFDKNCRRFIKKIKM